MMTQPTQTIATCFNKYPNTEPEPTTWTKFELALNTGRKEKIDSNTTIPQIDLSPNKY